MGSQLEFEMMLSASNADAFRILVLIYAGDFICSVSSNNVFKSPISLSA